ncbi:MAG TPA: BTAD domain-containing putative transcriptional regulator, partial [Burkholderiaceae bacterium]|nr:BTAD domain-containing putative transcriptional regulator [Burkholderiaceae bacterium]
MSRAPVTLILHGPMRLALPEGAAALRYAKGRALLAYLALHLDQWVARRTVAALLWPALDEPRALTNLRQVLAPLQRTLGADGADLGLRAERERLMLAAHPGLFIDTALLMAPCPDLSDEAGQARLEALLPAPGQPFLADLCLPECPDFEDWRAQLAAQLRERHRGLLRALCEAQEASGRLAAAVQSARQVLTLDPLDEAAAARLMQLLLQAGDRRAAEQVLADTDQLLVRQLGHRAGAGLRRLLEVEPAG